MDEAFNNQKKFGPVTESERKVEIFAQRRLLFDDWSITLFPDGRD